MKQWISFRVPTAYHTDQGVKPLVRFLKRKDGGEPFAAITCPINTMAASGQDKREDITFYEFTLDANWVYTAHDKRNNECSESVGTAIVTLPVTGADGDYMVRLKRDMGDWGDDGKFVSNPVEKIVSSIELAAAFERQREEYTAFRAKAMAEDAPTPQDGIAQASAQAAFYSGRAIDNA